jgi:hypothetical protein
LARPRPVNGRYVMRRRPLKFAATASLLLCVATVALWVRSYSAIDIVRLRTGGRWFYCSTYPASVTASTWLLSDLEAGADRSKSFELDYEALPGPRRDWDGYLLASTGTWQMLGFWYVRTNRVNPSYRTVRFPDWFLVVTFSVLPAIALARARRRTTRGNRGLCPNCGYDLRATPDRCPECGSVPAESAAKAAA